MSSRNEYSGKLIDRTLALWQPRYQGSLTEEDAREMIENGARFVAVLVDWAQEVLDDASNREGGEDDAA